MQEVRYCLVIIFYTITTNVVPTDGPITPKMQELNVFEYIIVNLMIIEFIFWLRL
jgi:hypothetical protein